MSKTVFITGATAGFGKAMAERYAAEGWQLIVSGRREDRLEELKAELAPTAVHTVCFDVRDREATQAAIAAIPPQFADIDVLVNNAGLALGMEPVHKCDLDEWDCMIDTNIKGLLYVTRTVVEGMVERGRGHIVNLGSVAGTYPYPGGNTYGATKAFVKQFSLNMRADLLGTPVRVTNIEPGLCESEFSVVRFRGDASMAEQVYKGMQPIVPEDIAEIIYWVTTLPPHVNINALEVMPVDQAFSPFAINRS
ncbi:SDR family oxidoreductase [Pseudodesulfovibrio piezophilus]|uniref:NADP-dependent L-serine/L-allo-threonine dehydrogenase ydfG n=1 Tax=Pseudodesulfovibrio piezophilus (strain DSM 21447 / JCM 15486 / C1TLV30) TaxID=1322246 RepID=M1WWB0_PSEP2|nr:SDR family oxidoreductase [Pseudodesulfovibrio piezophilus]CCH49038.1 NADP-dependent L-serine/L-allo-threonine dehydrogenase ydfG [Pseudodesulfovibrio piezophilus C1TLV30]